MCPSVCSTLLMEAPGSQILQATVWVGSDFELSSISRLRQWLVLHYSMSFKLNLNPWPGSAVGSPPLPYDCQQRLPLPLDSIDVSCVPYRSEPGLRLATVGQSHTSCPSLLARDNWPEGQSLSVLICFSCQCWRRRTLPQALEPTARARTSIWLTLTRSQADLGNSAASACAVRWAGSGFTFLRPRGCAYGRPGASERHSSHPKPEPQMGIGSESSCKISNSCILHLILFSYPKLSFHISLVIISSGSWHLAWISIDYHDMDI